jgi:SOS response regulatory protein OraA/RecX
MNLKQLLKSKGISNDIIKAVEKKTAEISEEREMNARLQAQQMTKDILKEMLASQVPPSPKKKTIIMPD